MSAQDAQDLRAGDVVVVAHSGWPEGSFIRGELYEQECGPGLYCCGFQVANSDGTTFLPDVWAEVTVVSRAPRPLYVNHPRTEPVNGDTVADEDNGGADWTWHRVHDEWLRADGASFVRSELPARLRLLVDGETGRVVPQSVLASR